MRLTGFNTRRQSLGRLRRCCQHIHNIKSTDGEVVMDCDRQSAVSLDAPVFPRSCIRPVSSNVQFDSNKLLLLLLGLVQERRKHALGS